MALRDAFAGHLGLGSRRGVIRAAPYGLARMFCFGHDKPVCAFHDGRTFQALRVLDAPGEVASVARLGDADWIVTVGGDVFRRDGDAFRAVPRPAGTAFVSVAGTGERDVWADIGRGWVVLHFDGERWTDVPVPVEAVGGFAARAANDVWTANGKAHWDGKRWSLVYGAPAAVNVLPRPRPDDVWLAGDGLWHTSAPGPTPVRLPPPAAPPEGALPAPAPLPLGEPETHYDVARASLAPEKLASARRVAAAADGTLWLQDWDRLVEVDPKGHAAVLPGASTGSFARAVYPEGKGRGLVLRDGLLQRLDGRRTTAIETQLDGRAPVAVDGTAAGAVWMVGTSASEARSPQALVRAGREGAFQLVLGLPAATWTDVSAASDGGAWLAGALSPGPSGEGLLFHARGRTGSEATARFRAAASLLAVAAAGPDEAWAVGAAGTVVHVKGATVERLVLGSGAWLRAVCVVGPDDVWIGGDDGTLLHHDGRGFHPVGHPLGGNAAVTSIAAAQGAVWAVGPSGILRIARRP